MIACKKCGEEFETGPEVGVHARDAHSKSAEPGAEVPYRCFRCNVLFEYVQGFLNHACPNFPDDKQSAYDDMIERFMLMGLEPRVDAKGITGYHLP